MAGPQQSFFAFGVYWKCHSFLPVAASSAVTLENGSLMYMTPSSTSGVVSKVAGLPVW